MEKKIYTDDFELLLKEKSDQFRMYPSKRVWHSIYNDLHPGRKWPSVAMSMVLILALLLIGYLNTGDNTITGQIAGNNISDQDQHSTEPPAAFGNIKIKNQSSPGYRDQPISTPGSRGSSKGDIADATETASRSFVKYVDPSTIINTGTNINAGTINNSLDKKTPADRILAGNNGKDLIQTIDTYIKTNQIFADVAVVNKKKKGKVVSSSKSNADLNTDQQELSDESIADLKKVGKESAPVNIPVAGPVNPSEQVNKLNTPDKLDAGNGKENAVAKNDINAANKSLSAEEKAWIENYAMHNKSPRSKWKGRTAIEFYVTPSLNYRQLSTDTKGSVTPFANANINNAVSQKPGLGLEGGIGLSYAFAKNLRIKAGIQFNYTSYGINADQTNHPVLTSLLLNDPNTGYSYSAIRTSTLSNPYNSPALQPVTIHNTTYQVSIPVGLALKLASNNKLEWFAGASIQPTYVFGGNAYHVSTDLKDYIAEPSSIRSWNLNTGIETYINYKFAGFTLQVGPQVRYQLFSTYRKDYTLVEKPYAVGLKFGIVKSF